MTPAAVARRCRCRSLDQYLRRRIAQRSRGRCPPGELALQAPK